MSRIIYTFLDFLSILFYNYLKGGVIITNYLGSFIKYKRGKKSLREFSNIIGISHSHLDSIEKGYDPKTGKPVNLSLEILNKLATVLNVDDLLLIYLAKTDNKQCEDLFAQIAELQTKYKSTYNKYFNFDENDVSFSNEKAKKEWIEEKERWEKDFQEIGENELLLLLFQNCSTEDIINLIKDKISPNILDTEEIKKVLNILYHSPELSDTKKDKKIHSILQKNTEKKFDELEILFNKNKDILSDDDKETIKFVIEKAKRKIDAQLGDDK